MTDFAARRVMMVDNQIRPSDVTKYPVIAAFLATAREAYVPADRREAAYVGENLDLAPGRVMLEPRTLAKMLDVLDFAGDELVLDIGSGLGCSAAVTARMAQMVVALETAPLAAGAEAALAGQGVDNVTVVTGELAAGAPAHAPYDVILLQGGVEELPAAIADQLRLGGRICCLFMSGALGTVRLGTKTADGIVWRDAFNAAAPVLPGFARKAAFAL